MPNYISKSTGIVTIAMLLTVCSSDALAQRSRGSETDLLRRTEVHTELGLSEEQSTKLQELQAKSNPSREDFDKIKQAIDAAETEEEKKKIRDDFSEQIRNSRTLFQDNALGVLNSDQKAKLRGLYLTNAGPRGLTNELLAQEYGLTDEQAEKLEEIASQERTAARSLADDASFEEREKFAADWKEKQLAVLTAEQKSRFEKELAQAPSREESSIAGPPASGTQPAGAPRPPGPPGGVVPMAVQPPDGVPATASFGSDSAPGQRKLIDEFSFNFRFAPWDQVLQMFADGTGLTLDLGQVPPGTFSHLDDKKYTAKEALDIINGYLLRKGFGMFQKEGFLIVINLDQGIPPSLLRDVSVEELLQLNPLVVGNNELVNVTMEVADMDTAKAAQEIEALIGPWGSMIALTESHMLIITDIGSNLRRINGLLALAMSKAKPDALIFKSYYLEHIDVEEAQTQVMTQFGMRENVQNVSAANERSRFQSRTQSRTQQAPQQPAPTSAQPELQIAADLRLSSLLVTGTAKQHELVDTILTALDVGEGPDGKPLVRGRKGTYLEVYQLNSSDAQEVAKTLSAMNMPGVTVVNEDGRNGRLHIMASERMHVEVAALVRQLDGSGSAGSVAVIQLHQMDPLSAAATLRSLFYADGDDAPTIETDLYGRRLIIRGSVDHIAQIKQVLADLGETGGPRERIGGTVRRVPLQGRDPEKFLRILKQEWESKETSRLNIFIPEEDGPVKSRQTSEGELELETPGGAAPANRIPTPERPAPGPTDDSGEPTVSKVQRSSSQSEWGTWQKPSQSFVNAAAPVSNTATGQDEETTAAETASAAQGTGADEPPRRSKSTEVIVLGDELIITSGDEEELDRLEDLLDMLQQTLPFKQEFTQFFLKSADALEASDMLSQFFPSSSVATTSMASGGGSMLGSLAGSLGSMGSSLMDATGLSGLGSTSNSLKIIPDIRTNSLFMAGPPMMVKDAISLLKVLDSNDGPESLKDMQARTIEVEYADVQEVKSMLDDLFKTYLEAQNQGRQQQQNPLAAMFGGGGGGRGGNNEAAQVRMHLAVDQQNSLILVNSSQELFDEVDKVVKGLDQAAQQANRLIRVIQLKNADASMIQQSLTSLLPRVSVSSSRTGGSSSGSPSGAGGAPPSGGGGDAARAQQEAFSRMIQERMRQGSSGGGVRAPTTGRGGFGGGRGSGGSGFGFGGRGPGGR